jgi:ArsR family transcriptional regulator
MNMDSYRCCSKSDLSNTQLNAVSTILKVVAAESRLRLLCLLCQGEHCVCDILPHLKMSQSLVSHHLRDLKDAGLVSHNKVGLKVFYSLTEYGREMTQILFTIPII